MLDKYLIIVIWYKTYIYEKVLIVFVTGSRLFGM
jgi:hypothetical protein